MVYEKLLPVKLTTSSPILAELHMLTASLQPYHHISASMRTGGTESLSSLRSGSGSKLTIGLDSTQAAHGGVLQCHWC